MTLNQNELDKWEATRDLEAEISQGVSEMFEGKAVQIRTVSVSLEIHEKRMKGSKESSI